ncbi:MAG TPA: transcriptional regulator [Methylocystis sp.]|nr:transcriptional regulator [Methylocystis sp.]
MVAPNEIIHQSLRLKIMGSLNALAHGEELDFTRLRVLTGATDGNLGAHLATLENAGYVQVSKSFVAKRPCTRVRLTPEGAAAFAEHVAFLRQVIDQSAPVTP